MFSGFQRVHSMCPKPIGLHIAPVKCLAVWFIARC